jgi:hypothetical protein
MLANRPAVKTLLSEVASEGKFGADEGGQASQRAKPRGLIPARTKDIRYLKE